MRQFTFFLLFISTLVQAQFNGTVDSTFAGSGVVLYDYNQSMSDEMVRKATFGPDGKLYVGGYTNGQNRNILIVRFNEDGTPDPDFGGNGAVAFDPSLGGNDELFDLLVTDDNKVMVIGGTNAGQVDQVIARFNEDGSLDPTFNQTGILITGNSYWDIWSSGWIDEEGRILAAGASSSLEGSQLSVGRYLSDGAADNSFGFQGTSILDFDENEYYLDIDGNISGMYFLLAVAGDKNYLIAMDDKGDIDYSFGTNGKVNLDLLQDYEEVPYQVKTNPADGSVYVVGAAIDGSLEQDLFVAKFFNNGSLDPDFAIDGVYRADLASGGDDVVADLHVLEDGSLLLSGMIARNGGLNLMTTQLSSDGFLSFSYGENGVIEYPVENDVDELGGQICLDLSGDIYIYGMSEQPESDDMVIIKLKTNTATGTTDRAIPNVRHFEVYPNPTKGPLNLTFELEQQQPVEIQMLQLDGRLMYSQPYQPTTAGLQSIELSQALGKAKPGMYLLQLQMEAGVISRKFVVTD
jgi:uncharacterized delta-60 repeat protein